MKKRFLVALGCLPMLIGLASCNQNSINSSTVEIEDSGNSITTTEARTNTSSSSSKIALAYDPVYVHYDINFNTTNDTTKKDVEETVEDVYGSVVSIVASNTSGASAGSGVLFAYSNDYNMSFIVTCFHVIEDYNNFEITYNNNTMDESDDVTYQAKLVGGYEDSDLAILSIDATNLVYADIFENSDNLKLGSSVVCIGNPLGTLPGSVSSGVVSYVNRSVPVDTYTDMSLIQTDVAINSGNSGGGLFNTSGALIGIVNAKYSSTGIEGLGFAIPSKEVIRVVSELLNNSKYDIANNIWSYGYVNGDFEFGFTISYYGGQFNQSGSLYISSVESDSTYTGNTLSKNYIISKISVDYNDDSKTDTLYQVPSNPSSNDAVAAMQYLYNSNLSLGDKITFTYKDSSSVTFDVVQFIYSI
ncbi:MAG: trypsin-like peptidase domain-containing protein [Acholeplasmatales bacterium]|nr:trypsin-like peptidase domain-containing protein [Acholeplasmatales bacterium]